FNNLFQVYELQDNNIEAEVKTELEEKSEFFEDLNMQINNILSLSKIETYRKIYMKKPIENEEETEIKEKHIKKAFEKQDDNSYLYKFNTITCCVTKCLSIKINQSNALAKY
ncbi:12168_t:CDS:1, partial [Funneliformis geosporum]